jgi:excisionase family DNA binding protein
MKDFMFRENVLSVEPLTVSVKEAAKMLGVCERTVRTLTKSGVLPVIRIASRVLYSREDLIAFVWQGSKQELGKVNE